MQPVARDRRGVTAVMFACLAATLLGFAALATEAATWYLARQQAYSVADASAVAGALVIAAGGSSGDAAAAVAAAALANGFGPGDASAIAGAAGVSVTANNPPLAGAYAGDPTAAEVVISIDFPTALAALFQTADITVGTRSVARVQPFWPVCALSLDGPLSISMNLNAFVDENCYFASNATGRGAIEVTDGTTLYLYGLTTQGDCGGCPQVSQLWGGFDANQQSYLYRPNGSYQPATSDPFAPKAAALAGQFPATTAVVCPQYSAGGFFQYTDYPSTTPPLDARNCPLVPARVKLTGSVPPTQPDPDIPSIASACAPLAPDNCAFFNMDITIDSTVVLQPGTYLLLNASLAMTANANVSCFTTNYTGQNYCGLPFGNEDTIGVTFVLANPNGAQPQDTGQVRVDPAASVTLDAASNAAFPVASFPSSPLNGVLIYRAPDNFAPESDTAPAVVIEDDLTNQNVANNGQPSLFNGVLYFPGATAWFAANTWYALGGPNPHCDIIIAGTLNLGYWPQMPGQGSASYWSSYSLDCSGRGIEVLRTGNLNLPYAQAAKVVE